MGATESEASVLEEPGNLNICSSRRTTLEGKGSRSWRNGRKSIPSTARDAKFEDQWQWRQ